MSKTEERLKELDFSPFCLYFVYFPGSNHFSHTSMDVPSNSQHFTKLQTSGYSPAIQKKNFRSFLFNSNSRPMTGWMTEPAAPSVATFQKDREYAALQEASGPLDKPATNCPQSILVRPDSNKTNTEKVIKPDWSFIRSTTLFSNSIIYFIIFLWYFHNSENVHFLKYFYNNNFKIKLINNPSIDKYYYSPQPAKSVRFLTDDDSPLPRPRISSWSSGSQVPSNSHPGPPLLEVWAPSLTLGRDGPGIILKEGKAPVLRKGIDTTVSDLNSNLQKPICTPLSAVSAQFSPSRWVTVWPLK